MNLDKVFKSRRGSELNSTQYTYGDNGRVPLSQNSQRPPKGKFMLPKLGPDGTMIQFVRQAETAGVNKRRNLEYNEKPLTTNQSPKTRSTLDGS